MEAGNTQFKLYALYNQINNFRMSQIIINGEAYLRYAMEFNDIIRNGLKIWPFAIASYANNVIHHYFALVQFGNVYYILSGFGDETSKSMAKLTQIEIPYFKSIIGQFNQLFNEIYISKETGTEPIKGAISEFMRKYCLNALTPIHSDKERGEKWTLGIHTTEEMENGATESIEAYIAGDCLIVYLQEYINDVIGVLDDESRLPVTFNQRSVVPYDIRNILGGAKLRNTKKLKRKSKKR